jgi:hypothetical protein
VHTISELKSNSNTAIFLGSGSSINEITPEQWDVLKRFDLWTVNNWVYHPAIVPHFYHIEVKHYNYKLIQKRLKEKRYLYRDVNFIFPKDKTIRLLSRKGNHYIRDVAKGFKNIFEYRGLVRNPKRTHNPFNANYIPDPVRLTKSYDMSLTAVFELMWKMNYERIVTFGIDLRDSYYFWTGGDTKYGKVHHQTNKAHENKPPAQPHATFLVKDFLIDFNRRWFRRHKKEGIFVGHISTALYPEIPWKKVEELV